jgi:LPXTG-motif cell wall-anchored protein
MSKILTALIISLGSIGVANADCGLLSDLLGNCSPSSGPVQAPEIDPASALSGLTLLAGGLVVLRGRKRGKK